MSAMHAGGRARRHASWGMFTRLSAKVNFAAADVGKTAYYFARWQTARGLVGPLNTVISKTIGD